MLKLEKARQSTPVSKYVGWSSIDERDDHLNLQVSNYVLSIREAIKPRNSERPQIEEEARQESSEDPNTGLYEVYRKLLIVDDEPFNQIGLKFLLS